MPTLTSSPARQAAQDYAISVSNLVPTLLATGGMASMSPVHSAYDPVYRADLVETITVTVRQIESALLKYEVPQPSVAGLVFMEEPDNAPAYQDAYEWESVSVRVIEDEDSGYVGDGDVWR